MASYLQRTAALLIKHKQVRARTLLPGDTLANRRAVKAAELELAETREELYTFNRVLVENEDQVEELISAVDFNREKVEEDKHNKKKQDHKTKPWVVKAVINEDVISSDANAFRKALKKKDVKCF